MQIVGMELRPVNSLFGQQSEPIQLGPVNEHTRRVASPAAPPRATSLTRDQDYMLLWWSRLLGQTAQGAVLYALMILVIDLSDRSFFSSLFVACSSVASIALGLPAGIVVDNFPRRLLMFTLNMLRFLFMLMLVAVDPGLPSVFAATMAIWIIHQFYSPSEASTLADLVPPRQYVAAQSMFNLALTIAQGVGLAVVAPILLRLGGARLVFVLAGALWLLAAAIIVLLPPLQSSGGSSTRRNVRATLTAGLSFVRRDRPTLEAILDDVLVSLGMSTLVVVIPFYLERVLGTSKENTVFVFAPAAVGLMLGLRLAPIFSRMIGERVTAFLSVSFFAGCVFCIGFVRQTYDLLNATLGIPLDQITDWLSISPFILLTMMLSIPAGMANSIVNVSARSILLHRTPGHVRGQVIASQSLIGNVLGLVPTLLAGLATDLFGVLPVAVGIAVVILMGGLLARQLGRGGSAAPEAVALPA